MSEMGFFLTLSDKLPEVNNHSSISQFVIPAVLLHKGKEPVAKV